MHSSVNPRCKPMFARCMVAAVLVFLLNAAPSLLMQPDTTQPDTTNSSATESQPTSTESQSAEPADNDQVHVAVCAVVRNQNEDLREWIHYHHWIGVQKIFLYDHNSTNPALNEIQDWVRSGVVEYSFFAGHRHLANLQRTARVFAHSAQGYAYDDCLARAQKHRIKWMAFIDIDEFIVIYQDPYQRNITAFLKQYEEFGALVVNWRIFGSSGHKTRPSQPTMEAFTACHPTGMRDQYNKHIKSIVHVPNTLGSAGTPHMFRYTAGKFPVTEEYQECSTMFCRHPKFQRVGLHHYVLKSEQQFEEKVSRGGGAGKRRGTTYWKAINGLARGQCSEGVELSKWCCSQAAQDGYPAPTGR